MHHLFWKALALAAVVGVFYVGHGLHQSAGPAGDASWLPAAEAQAFGPKKPFVWQTISREGNSTEFDIHTQRASVPGGWLVWQMEIRAAKAGGGMAFLPDPEHRWDGTTLK